MTTVVDPESLFEGRTIPEIVTFSQSLSQDIDRKREEVRTMVGERYRDLMEAADTILMMKDVISNVEDVLGKGAELHNKAISGFGSKPFTREMSTEHDPLNKQYLAVGAEIKILMMAPEKIWSAVEKYDYLMAAQFFLFAQHVYTNLSLNIDSADAGSNELSHSAIVNTHFPVVSRLWDSISHFYDAIRQGCHEMMGQTSGNLSNQSIIDSMAAMLLMQDLTSEVLFQEFLKIRKSSLDEQLKRDSENETAKMVMENSLKIIHTTLSVIHHAFVGTEGHDTLAATLESVSTEVTLSYFETRLSPVFKHIPGVISVFRPKAMTPFKKVTAAFLQETILAWLDSIHDPIVTTTISALSHVNSIPALANIRQHCYTRLSMSDKTWGQLCTDLLQKELILWNEYYLRSFRDRVEALLMSKISGAFYYVQSTLSQGDELFAQEKDLSTFLWSDTNLNELNSLPKFGETLGLGRAKARPSSLELKAQGFSPKVQEVCTTFDSQLHSLLSDIEAILVKATKQTGSGSRLDTTISLLPEESTEKWEPFDMSADDNFILQFVRETTIAQTNGMIESIATKFVEKSSNMGQLLFIGRFYQALPQLCWGLEECVSTVETESIASPLTTSGKYPAKGDPQWTSMKNKFEHESCKAFTKWIDLLCLDMKNQILSLMGGDFLNMLKTLPAWEVIEISEETDDGQNVKSRISVPQHLSVALTTALGHFCNSVYSIAPYSLPSKIQNYICHEAVMTVTAAYADIASRSNLKQRIALQLYFDLSFVQQCMMSRDNKSSRCSEVLNQLEALIDPFDLSVFSSHMAVNVKRCVLREQGLLSILIPNDRFALLASMKSSLPPQQSSPASTSGFQDQQQQHNLLWSFPHCPPKIALVPIPKRRSTKEKNRAGLTTIMPSASSLVAPTRSRQSLLSSVSPVTARKKRDRSPVAKAAGSFFEAMSSSWFGGK